MRPIEQQFTFEQLQPTAENLTALLTCCGAKTSQEDNLYILNRQNPYKQKRGGLGFGAYAMVKIPGGGKTFSNINIYNQQANVSPLTLRIAEPEAGEFFLLDVNENVFTTGNILPIPNWGTKNLSTGKPAITVLQQHGPVNLVGVLGTAKCSLFENGNACSFCMLNGDETNSDRSVEEILEAFELARDNKAAYNLTLTAGLQASANPEKTIEAVKRLKQGISSYSLALEVAPFSKNCLSIFKALKEAGLDTLMMPLDCATKKAQRCYLPGKADLLEASYWENVLNAVEIFGKGNVTSSIIVGLESFLQTLQAIEKMLIIGVIPEPIPVRWDDSKLAETPLPLTDPANLLKARKFIQGFIGQRGMRETIARTRAGCAACGGCSGIPINNLIPGVKT